MEPGAYDELNALEATHWWYEGMRRITRHLLLKTIGEQNSMHILDAGCGAGGNLTALSEFGQVWGFDYSPLALRYAAQQHRGQLAQGSIEAIPFASNRFEMVFSFDVLCVREVGDDRNGFAEMARVARPGGYVLVRLPALSALKGPHDTYVHGVRRYTAAGLSQKLREAGLEPLVVTYANTLLLPAIFLARRLQSLIVMLGREPTSDVNQTPPLVNRLLTALLTLEARWIGRGGRLPAGVSVFGIARKPA